MSVLETIKQEKLLVGIALDVYTILSQYNRLTVGEITKKYQATRPKTRRGRNEIAKRVRDLEVWGAIEKSGTSTCELTGRMVHLYQTTGNLPVRRPAIKYTRKEESVAEVKGSLLKEIDDLTKATIADAVKLDDQVSVLLTALAHGECHIEELKRLHAEKVDKMYGLFTSKKRRLEIRNEIDAINFVLGTLSYVKNLGATSGSES